MTNLQLNVNELKMNCCIVINDKFTIKCKRT